MKLLPLSSPADIELAAAWLQLQENYQWLDFGNGRQCVTPTLLRIMSQRDSHFIRIYTSEHDHDTPIGIVGLNSVDRHFRTATLWVVAGDKSFRYRGYAQLAASRFLTLAFRDLGLHSVNTWAVEHNVSVRAALRVGFRFVGRQRQCHLIDGRLCDRLLFDLLASEHREIEHPLAAARAPDSPARAPALGSPA
jgi:RimJ/RimL family protein N-acetyltransferase